MIRFRARGCALAMTLGVLPLIIARGAGAAGLHAASSLTRIESSAPVFSVLYRYGQNTPASNGAYGPNVAASRLAWFLEYQRAGALDVIDGVVRADQDPNLVHLGLHMFHFGLARQASDGLFPGSATPFHGTAMFLSEAAPALLMLQNSALAQEFTAETRWEIARMRRAAYAMVQTVGGPGKLDDYTKNHRWFEAAIALAAVGALADDSTLRRWSTIYAWHGIHMARADGIMPEDGGHDTGYQALGMINASRYLTIEATGPLYTALHDVLMRGETWLLSRVNPDGVVDQQGDTRSAGCQERDPTGQCKSVMYAPIYSSLAHWAAISGNAQFSTASHQVWYRAGYWSRH